MVVYQEVIEKLLILRHCLRLSNRLPFLFESRRWIQCQLMALLTLGNELMSEIGLAPVDSMQKVRLTRIVG